MHATREPVAPFTETRTVHPDDYWRPLGGELDSRAPSLSSEDQGETRQQPDAGPGRPGIDAGGAFDLHGTTRMIRSVLRPGG